jgi:hypothetical protein
MGMADSAKSPAALDVSSRVKPLSGLEIVTFAPGITAPLESMTVPTIFPVSWLQAESDRKQIRRKLRARVFLTVYLLRMTMP